MVVVENDIGDTFQLRNNITNHQNNRNNNMAQNNIKSDDADEISNPNPSKPNMIYHQKKIRRKDSLSSYSSLEIHRIRNQDPNLLNRPAWTDARIALLQIKKVNSLYDYSIAHVVFLHFATIYIFIDLFIHIYRHIITNVCIVLPTDPIINRPFRFVTFIAFFS